MALTVCLLSCVCSAVALSLIEFDAAARLSVVTASDWAVSEHIAGNSAVAGGIATIRQGASSLRVDVSGLKMFEWKLGQLTQFIGEIHDDPVYTHRKTTITPIIASST